ncbi:MAG: hypothetical protein N2249_04490 [Melioribacter sp.]|nr:hypothetical protein [Melioribacter sp.]
MKFVSLKNFLVIVFTIACLLFIHVATVSEIKNMKKEKISKLEQLNEKLNKIEMKIVERQKLIAEDRIVNIAKDSLGLILPTKNIQTIKISKEQIKRVEKLVKEKYD